MPTRENAAVMPMIALRIPKALIERIEKLRSMEGGPKYTFASIARHAVELGVTAMERSRAPGLPRRQEERQERR